MYNQALGVCRGLAFWVMGWLLSGYSITKEFEIRTIPFVIGDTNLDGRIDIRDVTAIQRHIAELDMFTEEQLAAADTNGDGKVDITDATHLQMYLAEYDVQLG